MGQRMSVLRVINETATTPRTVENIGLSRAPARTSTVHARRAEINAFPGVVQLSRRARGALHTLLAIVCVCTGAGCSSVAYYGQAVSGQMALLVNRRDLAEVIADDSTDPEVRAKLRHVERVLGFAAAAGLPVGGSYGAYVDLERPYVVWNVYAAPEFSLAPHTFCYLVVGCLAYKGFFAEEDARALAATLEAEGFDTWVGGVAAYSTLGWFDDPILSSFVVRSDGRLAALLFHELAHKVVFIKGDTAFNEGFATAVELILLQRWLDARGAGAEFDEHVASSARRQAFTALVLEERKRLEALYATGRAPAAMREAKADIIEALRERYRSLAAGWPVSPYSGWIEGPINNAKLANVATYHAHVPAFRALYTQAGSIGAFFDEVRALSKLDSAPRAAKLQELADLADAQETSR